MSMEIDEAVVIGARPGSRPQAESYGLIVKERASAREKA